MRIRKRFTPIAWAFIVVQGLMVARRHWGGIPPRSRARARELVAKSKGRPGNLTSRERKELVGIARQVDLSTLARDLADVASPVRLPGRGRHH